ncbi:MAG TPA: hemerythrin domain-containing protein [Marmoricola sp.]|nr:hemerythrin domain-containing protein [Marmoricola sp.]
MCEYCGCRQVEPLAELMDEHVALLDLGGDVRRSLSAGDRQTALALLRRFAEHLASHVRREERGIFTALRSSGEYLEEVDQLEGEHVDLDKRLAALELDSPDLAAELERLLMQLTEHVEREDLGIFPVSVVTLDAAGWETVTRAHDEQPTFLTRS